MKQKPKQKFEINFQRNTSEQLREMTSSQLVRLFLTIASLLPISADLMNEYHDEFEDFLKMIGSTIGQDIRRKTYLDRAPDIEDLTKSSTESDSREKYSLLYSFLSGVGGPMLNQNLATNILESILKLVLLDSNSLIGWRDSLVIYVRTHSKAIVTTLSTIMSHPSYH